MNVNLISVDLDEPSHDWQSNIRLAISATHRRLYVYFEGAIKRKLSSYPSARCVKHCIHQVQGNKHTKLPMLVYLHYWRGTTTKSLIYNLSLT